MKMNMIHDTAINTITMCGEGIKITYTVSEKLKEITSLVEYEHGFLVMNTNYGEEYADYIELIDTSLFDKAFKEKAKAVFRNLKLEDIILKRR